MFLLLGSILSFQSTIAMVGICGQSATPGIAPPNPVPPLQAVAMGQSARSRRRTWAPYTAATVSGGGKVVGTVMYRGKVPPATRIQVVKDQAYCNKHAPEVPQIRIDEKQRVADAVVFLAGITQGKAFPSRPKPPVIDQNGCEFVPHVQIVRVKESVDVLNSDSVAHNIHANQRIYTLFNILQPSQGMRSAKSFDKPGLVELKCNVHDWMHGYVYVLPHPYAQVTGADGAFAMEDVPPGRHELVIWQEYLGEQAFPVEVSSGKESVVTIELKPRPGEEAPGK